MYYLEINNVAKWKFVVEQITEDLEHKEMLFVQAYCDLISSRRTFWISKSEFKTLKKELPASSTSA